MMNLSKYLCGVSFFVRNAMLNYNIRPLIHEFVLFSMDSRGVVETSQVVQSFHNQPRYMSTT